MIILRLSIFQDNQCTPTVSKCHKNSTQSKRGMLNKAAKAQQGMGDDYFQSEFIMMGLREHYISMVKFFRSLAEKSILTYCYIHTDIAYSE